MLDRPARSSHAPLECKQCAGRTYLSLPNPLYRPVIALAVPNPQLLSIFLFSTLDIMSELYTAPPDLIEIKERLFAVTEIQSLTVADFELTAR